MSRGAFFRTGVLLAVVGAAALCWWMFEGHLKPASIEAVVAEAGPLAPVVFVGAFALATLLFVPGSIFGLAGGVLFGPLWGSVWNLAGGTLGATAAFLFARFVAGDWIAAKARGRLKTVLLGVETEGWRFVALTRLVPVVPFNVLNYVLGLTRIPLAQYMLTTLVGMVPGTAAYAWLGHAGRAAIEGNTDALRYGALGLAALALVVLAPRLLRQFKRQSTAFVSVRDLQLLAREQRPLIVDVREPDEFKGPLGHIEGAINIPLGQLTTEWRKPDDRTYPLVAVCRTDTRSVKAADILRQSGIPNVKILRGGMEAWSKG